ncbi:hypothetical protein FH972_020979 [Carpinus fangiana]|uniref:Major facilitator superfamily (MFS) profile domain-containing protein n=1 Tax=Carpinus fangiana TaxID=176857 RepID=A0A5N6KN06_9ROSI|nr:hypothetical protein FH972_020979 [Carpinus fangiana]
MAQATAPQDPAALSSSAPSVPAQQITTHQRQVELSYLEGHDADIPSNDAVALGVDTKAVLDPKELEAAPSSTPSPVEPSEKTASANDKDVTRDPNVVTWDGPDDPENPMNWTDRKKWLLIAVVSSITFTTPLASSMFAPGVPQLMREFNSDSTLLASFVVSVFLLGFVFGPLFIAPMSELYGRMPAYHIANVVFLAFTLGCAFSTNLAMFCVFRLLMGIAGSAPLTVGGGTIADLMPPEKRGAALSIWALGPLMGEFRSSFWETTACINKALGPVLGPIIGGYLTQCLGWRWVFYLLAIIVGVLTVSSGFLMRETYAPVILSRRCKALRKSTGNPALHTVYDGLLTPSQLFRKAIIRPTKMLTRSPMVFFLSLHVSIAFSYLYLLFTTFTFVFERQYGFTPGESGLTFLGVGVGMLLGLVIMGKLSDKILKAKAAANGGQIKPEYRLPLMPPGSILIPIGLFWSTSSTLLPSMLPRRLPPTQS